MGRDHINSMDTMDEALERNLLLVRQEMNNRRTPLQRRQQEFIAPERPQRRLGSNHSSRPASATAIPVPPPTVTAPAIQPLPVAPNAADQPLPSSQPITLPAEGAPGDGTRGGRLLIYVQAGPSNLGDQSSVPSGPPGIPGMQQGIMFAIDMTIPTQNGE